jgi:hypothetical protein
MCNLWSITGIVYIPVPPEIADRISAWGESHVGDHELGRKPAQCAARIGRNDYHITLSTSVRRRTLPQLRSSCIKLEDDACVTLGPISTFASVKRDVVKVEVQDMLRPDGSDTSSMSLLTVTDLKQCVDVACFGIKSLPSQAFRFSPHITICFCKPQTQKQTYLDDHPEDANALDRVVFPVDRFIYSDKGGLFRGPHREEFVLSEKKGGHTESLDPNKGGQC